MCTKCTGGSDIVNNSIHANAPVIKDIAAISSPNKVCMHVLRDARNDVRAMRTASALIEAGFIVSIIDIESEHTRPAEENIRGICIKHMIVHSSFSSTRFEKWAFVKAVQLFVRSILRLIQSPADIYHVCEVTALPACYIADRLRHFLGLSSHTRIALYQGYLQPDRSLDILVRAATYLDSNIVIVMMGKDIGATLSQLEVLISSEGVADRVKIIPPVLYQELLNWTASADVGLLVCAPNYAPNIQMLLPNKLFEYLMAGLPVLTSQLDAVVEVVKAYDVGQVVNTLAPADVGAAINTILADRAALAHMRQNALEAAKHEFCWEKESSRLIHFYRDICMSQC